MIYNVPMSTFRSFFIRIESFILLALLIFTLISSGFTHVFISIFIVLFILIALWQHHKNIDFFKIKKIGIENPALLFFITFFISNIFADINFSEKVRSLYDISWIVLLYCSIFYINKLHESKIEKAINVFLYACFIVFALSVVQLLLNTNFLHTLHHGRLTGYVGNPVPFGNTIAIYTSFLIAFLFQKTKNINKITLSITIGMLLFILLFTHTRGALLGCLFGSTFVLYLSSKKIITFLLYMLCVTLILLVSFPKLKNRIPKAGIDYSSSLRIKIWKSYYDIFQQKPIFGVGLFPRHKRFPEVYKKNEIKNAANKAVGPHNNLLQILASSGIVTFPFYLLLFISFFIITLKKLIQPKNLNGIQRAIIIGSLGAQVTFHISGLTSSNYLEITTRTALILILALSFSSLNSSNFSKN